MDGWLSAKFSLFLFPSFSSLFIPNIQISKIKNRNNITITYLASLISKKKNKKTIVLSKEIFPDSKPRPAKKYYLL